MTHLSLFSGIGGLDLAAEWAGFRTVGQCEWADYPTKVLEKHWPDVPRWRDIRTLTGDSFYERTGLRTVNLISGGFPCQPFSIAGKRRGKEDDRFLWPEMVRIVKELRPTWVVGENVAGIINMALDKVLSDLESEGYATRTFLLPAAGVGAPHRRYRTAIVGYSNRPRCKEQHIPRQPSEKGFSHWRFDEGDASNTKSGREQQHIGIWEETWRLGGCDWWAIEPNVGRVANGVPDRVDRIECLGNAVVPQQFYPVFKAIATIELMH